MNSLAADQRGERQFVAYEPHRASMISYHSIPHFLRGILGCIIVIAHCFVSINKFQPIGGFLLVRRFW